MSGGIFPRRPEDEEGHLDSFLREVRDSLAKLDEKGLFPYNIAPVRGLLERVAQHLPLK